MKKNRGFAKLVLALSVIMGGLTIILLFIQSQQSKNNTYITINQDEVNLVQFDEIKEGAPIAIVDTTIGEFRFVLFPEQSPNAVRNFIDLAESGYYDNTYVFDSESGAYSSAGSRLKNGELPDGYDKTHELVERELNQDLWPFKGAVCSLNTTVDRTFMQRVFGGGTYFNGSRFALINTIEFDEETKQQILEVSDNKKIGKAFVEHGGIPNFSQQITVIGQTYQGIEVVEKLSQLEGSSNGSYVIPEQDIMINSVRISEYSAESE